MDTKDGKLKGMNYLYERSREKKNMRELYFYFFIEVFSLFWITRKWNTKTEEEIGKGSVVGKKTRIMNKLNEWKLNNNHDYRI